MNGIIQLKPRIKVIGIGGCGGNILNNIIPHFPDNVDDFIACNTDAQALEERCIAKIKVQLGTERTKGLGAGGMPDVGAESAQETLNEILEYVKGADMVFLIAGMGGGTGTGATPIIADSLRNLGILVFTIVTEPFIFEGPQRRSIALRGIEDARNKSDALLVISNQKLFTIINPDTSLTDAFLIADTFFVSAVSNIMDLIQKPGLINVDFADVRSSMTNILGNAVFGIGEAQNSDESGYGRAITAAEMAVQCPLVSETSIRSAKCLLINITGGSDLKLFEVDAAVSYITSLAPDATVIFGTVFDAKMNGSIKVAFIATGIEGQPKGNVVFHDGSSIAMESSSPYSTDQSFYDNFFSEDEDNKLRNGMCLNEDSLMNDDDDDKDLNSDDNISADDDDEQNYDESVKKRSFFERFIGKKKTEVKSNQKTKKTSSSKSVPKFLSDENKD